MIAHRPLVMCLVTTLALTCTPASAQEERPAYAYDPTPDFIAFNPDYKQLKRKYRNEYELLKKRANDAEEKGRDTNCTKQVLDEVKWLLNYTADFPHLEKRLAHLRAMLDAPKDPHEKGRTKEDGSFGCCSEEWFFKLIKTDDEVLVREFTWRGLKHPVTLLDRINSPEKLKAHLESLLVSDVRTTGIDKRYELSLTASILTRCILWKIPSNYKFHPQLEDALIEFLDEHWQDSKTGYWGAWYKSPDGSIVKTSDLSTTFHFVHYREGDVEHWPQMLRTTLAMKNDEYPHGWLEDGKLSNHHNYDVVAILRRGWRHATDAQKAESRAEIKMMLDFCLNETLNDDGSFRLLPDESTHAGAQLFGVSFLDESGYINRHKRFWTDEPFPEADALRDKIQKRLLATKSADPEIILARLILAAAALAK